MTAYYNEIDPFAAQWLRNLINAGHIAPGIVDERSIEDVYPSDLRGFTQCHFFAGIGVWSHALRTAGWGDDRPVWTGSCPCQPFSAAGAGAGFDDERHLWPHFHHLIKECRPAIVLGEQVASKDADPWIDLVHTDLENLGYAFGAVAFPSAGIGAPHIRDRLYWVANTPGAGSQGRKPAWQRLEPQRPAIERGGSAGWLADAKQHSGGSQTAAADHGQPQAVRPADWAGGCGGSLGGLADDNGNRCSARSEGCASLGHGQASGADCGACWMADAAGRVNKSCSARTDQRPVARSDGAMQTGLDSAGQVNGMWADADWLLCRDGKWRPVEPGTFPLAHGAPARVGRLRAYGNAINAKAAQVFIECVMDNIA